MENDLLSRIENIIEEHLADEQFGVSELAAELNMSRSNLLRKVRKLTGLSISRLIRQTRLEHAMEMLKSSSLTVSEVSYKIGFSSVSYFVKCFGDHYGYPPGEVGKSAPTMDINASTSQTHQLAAIMFTDIEGYTALMQKDEQKAIELRNRHREVFNSYTKKYSGRILQYYGDGTLSTFSSAIDAVKCGIEMQLAFAHEPKIPIRIGIHSGDIIFSEDDIIGDGVNIASRIESLAVAGSVFISGKIYDEVKNKSDIYTISLGSYELKNVDKPIDVFAVSNPGLVVPHPDQIQGKGKVEAQPVLKKSPWSNNPKTILIGAMALVVVVASVLIFTVGDSERGTATELPAAVTTRKSIAVLPFRNDSSDSTNIYIVNGLMEAILNNLQKIENLRVISRTSVEKYRDAAKSIPEISQELNVQYFVEGSGQKIGDQILLNIQLVEASSDQHLWAEQYSRDAKDIFQLQQEVAKSIASEIEVFITPEEQQRIEKIPTENLEAYDYFLKGLDQFFAGTSEGLRSAISNFQMALELDPEFARAYADIAISYYYLDFLQAEKLYTEEINTYADKALLFDPQLPQGMVAKALYYVANDEFALALPHLEKALEYNPNSVMVIHILSDFYSIYSPDTRKYLEYAIKGVQLEIAADDSATASTNYLHLSNALIQSGFTEEAEQYINLSLNYNPRNIFSHQLRAYILYAKNKDLENTKDLLIKTLTLDSTRLDVIQEIAKVYYIMRDYQQAYNYYSWYLELKESFNMDIFPGENLKIALVFSKLGKQQEAAKYLDDFKEFADNDESNYKHLMFAGYYSYLQNTQESLKHLKLFAQQDYFYWIVLFLETDPIMDPIADDPEYKKIMADIRDKFWDRHDEIKASLTDQGLL